MQSTSFGKVSRHIDDGDPQYVYGWMCNNFLIFNIIHTQLYCWIGAVVGYEWRLLLPSSDYARTKKQPTTIVLGITYTVFESKSFAIFISLYLSIFSPQHFFSHLYYFFLYSSVRSVHYAVTTSSSVHYVVYTTRLQLAVVYTT